MTEISLNGLAKRFGRVIAVSGITATIRSGEFFGIVGPTGCGKTTLLRLIAGLIQPDSGEIRFDGRVVNRLPPGERRVRMVFQDYALYPHLRVFDERRFSNLGFPLNVRRLPYSRIKEVIGSVASRLGIGHELFPRRPRELSAGQRQKVAVGRAIALPPRVLLMDEPLSNLDPRSRLSARGAVRKLHDDLGATTVYVTHDLAEAFFLSDRIAVMRDGRFVQVGSPREIRRNPKDDFVRSFVRSFIELNRELLGDNPSPPGIKAAH